MTKKGQQVPIEMSGIGVKVEGELLFLCLTVLILYHEILQLSLSHRMSYYGSFFVFFKDSF